MNWFKFYGQDWLTDIKILRLSVEDRLCYLTLLCLASVSDIPGIIKACDEEAIIELSHIPFDPCDDNNPFNRAKGFIKRMNDNGMITVNDNGDVTVKNYTKRQGQSLTGYERVKKYREKQKKISLKVIKDNANDNANDNIRIEENRIDKTRIDNKKEILVAPSATPYSFKNKLEEMQKSTRRDIQVIAVYWVFKGIEFENQAQYEAALKRELQPAQKLKGYDDGRINGVMEWLNENCEVKWTLETVHKYIDDNLDAIKTKPKKYESRY